jgi:hypothetical protein
LKQASTPKNKVFFHLTTTGMGEYNNRRPVWDGYSYNSDLAKATVFFPG